VSKYVTNLWCFIIWYIVNLLHDVRTKSQPTMDGVDFEQFDVALSNVLWWLNYHSDDPINPNLYTDAIGQTYMFTSRFKSYQQMMHYLKNFNVLLEKSGYKSDVLLRNLNGQPNVGHDLESFLVTEDDGIVYPITPQECLKNLIYILDNIRMNFNNQPIDRQSYYMNHYIFMFQSDVLPFLQTLNQLNVDLRLLKEYVYAR